MFDYFMIDSDWPGKKLDENQQKQLNSSQKADIIKTSTLLEVKRLFSEIDVESRFIPYFSIFEFEALLFSDTDILASELGIEEKLLQEITDKYKHPEEINDGINTAPSKRLIKLCNDYKKVLYGKSISQKIGINNIRNKCPNFNKWLEELESLKN